MTVDKLVCHILFNPYLHTLSLHLSSARCFEAKQIYVIVELTCGVVFFDCGIKIVISHHLRFEFEEINPFLL
jgi:hypothetical protein